MNNIERIEADRLLSQVLASSSKARDFLREIDTKDYLDYTPTNQNHQHMIKILEHKILFYKELLEETPFLEDRFHEFCVTTIKQLEGFLHSTYIYRCGCCGRFMHTNDLLGIEIRDERYLCDDCFNRLNK